MKNLFTFLSFLLILSACKDSVTYSKEELLEEKLTNISTASWVNDYDNEPQETETFDQLYLVREDFVFHPFGYNPTLENIKAQYSFCELRLDTLIDDSYNDTVIYYKLHLNNSEFIFVQGFLNGIPANFLAGAKIIDDEIALEGGIRIGMDKMEFYKRFKDPRILEMDVIEIGDRDSTSVFEFLFTEDVLVEINYMGYIG
ncbi:MAG: hypothetical protein ACK4ND_18840 [Cytophagaceae bacterium]